MRARLLARDELASVTAVGLVGGVLLASVRVGSTRVAKGTRVDAMLAAAILSAVRAGDVTELHVAWPDDDDVHEDDAAERLGLAIGGGGIDMAAPRQSKLDLTAKWDGVLHVQVQALVELNALDPLEVFTQLHGQCVIAGEVVASVKVAPHLVAGEVLRRGIRIAREGGPIIEVRPYLQLDVPAIICEAIDARERERFAAGASLKLQALGSRFTGIVDAVGRTPAEALQAALDALAQVEGARVVLVAGVSAGDTVAPFGDALDRVGGRFLRRGLPAHPGSMAWLATRGATRFLGLPSCGMFSMATAADLVLPRLLTGEPLDARGLAELSHGGVLTRDMRFRMPAYARELQGPGDAVS